MSSADFEHPRDKKESALACKKAGATEESARTYLKKAGLFLNESDFDYCNIEELRNWSQAVRSSFKFAKFETAIKNKIREREDQQLTKLNERIQHGTETSDQRVTSDVSRSKNRSNRTVKFILISILIFPFFLYGAGMVYRAAIGCPVLENQDKCDAKRRLVESQKTENMPSVRGASLKSAQGLLGQLDMKLNVRQVDLLGSRGVWEKNNWSVVNQSPPAGTTLHSGDQVCLGIVKNAELNETLERMECWQEDNSILPTISETVQFVQHDLISISNLPSVLNGMQLRAMLEIEMDHGNTVTLPFCTYGIVKGTTANLKLDAGNGGDPGLFANGGQSFKAGLYLNWSGRYKYSIVRFEKTRSNGCFSF